MITTAHSSIKSSTRFRTNPSYLRCNIHIAAQTCVDVIDTDRARLYPSGKTYPRRDAPMRNAAATQLPNLWDDAYAAKLDEPGLLLYRSNLLGSDLRITNFGGGNTSAKVASVDPLDKKPVTVLWVKGSGGDIGSMK